MSKTKKKGIRSLAILLALILAIGFSLVTNAEAKSVPRLNYKKVTLVQGKKKKLKVRGTKKRVKWYSTKKSIATVSKKGVIKAKKKGKAIIVAKVGKKKYRCKIIVKKKTSEKKTNGKKVKLKKSVKKQLPGDDWYVNFSGTSVGGKKTSLIIGTSLDLFESLTTGPDNLSKTSNSVRSKYYKWYSSNSAVFCINKNGIGIAKVSGKSTVYCKYMTKSGEWKKTVSVTVVVADGGNVKFSYTLGMEESPFGYKNYKVWDFYKHDSYVESLPKFNTLTIRIQNNSPKDITIRGISLDVDTTPKSIDFETPDKKKVVISANSTKEVKYYSSCAYDCFDQEVLRNYIIDREVLKTVGIGYNYGKVQVVANNDFGSSYWRYYY